MLHLHIQSVDVVYNLDLFICIILWCVIDEDNNEIVRYVYDAYGDRKVELLNGSDYDLDYTNNSLLDSYHIISKENPFRYRGIYVL